MSPKKPRPLSDRILDSGYPDCTHAKIGLPASFIYLLIRAAGVSRDELKLDTSLWPDTSFSDIVRATISDNFAIMTLRYGGLTSSLPPYFQQWIRESNSDISSAGLFSLHDFFSVLDSYLLHLRFQIQGAHCSALDDLRGLSADEFFLIGLLGLQRDLWCDEQGDWDRSCLANWHYLAPLLIRGSDTAEVLELALELFFPFLSSRTRVVLGNGDGDHTYDGLKSDEQMASSWNLTIQLGPLGLKNYWDFVTDEVADETVELLNLGLPGRFIPRLKAILRHLVPASISCRMKVFLAEEDRHRFLEGSRNAGLLGILDHTQALS